MEYKTVFLSVSSFVLKVKFFDIIQQVLSILVLHSGDDYLVFCF